MFRDAETLTDDSVLVKRKKNYIYIYIKKEDMMQENSHEKQEIDT